MCGVVTIFSPDGGVEPEPIDRAVRALRHRGPDGSGRWIADHGRVGMGHARLSIIDLNTGQQPIASQNGKIHIVVNGEFYDHDRIRKELVARGHEFRTYSDSEILLHLYEDHGTACMEHLRGEFAFVLWDERNGLLVAGRDRFGIKPLYYAWHRGRLYVASEAKALFAAGMPAEWDRESFHQKLWLNGENDRSMFKDVRQVPPGHLLLATRWSSKWVPYWDQDYPVAGEMAPARSEAEVVEEMRAQLVEATRLRLRADVPVGCYLSGGLDSCSLIGVAGKLLERPIEAFTIAFEEEAYDEGPIAEEMAKLAGANFHCFKMSADQRADHFADAIWYAEDPHGNGNTVAKYLLSERVREFGFKVVLTGEGSDEIFGGYAAFRHDMVRHHSGHSAEQIAADSQTISDRNKVAFFLTRGGGDEQIKAAEGALDRGPHSLPRPPRQCRQPHADRHEDSRHHREVRSSPSRATLHHRHRLQAAEAPVLRPGRAARALRRDGHRRAARQGAGCDPVLRRGQGSHGAGRLRRARRSGHAGGSWLGPHRDRERLHPARALHALGGRTRRSIPTSTDPRALARSLRASG
jgi:asparagine synthase (glutamine-hydrolysing)